MKVSRSFALDIDDMKIIEGTAREMSITENAALALLVRHGSVRMKQMDHEVTHLAPDMSDLR